MSFHLEHRLVLPVPCTVAELRAALAALDGAAQIVDVALAGEDGRPVMVDGLADVVLTAVPAAGGDPASPVAASGGDPVAALPPAADVPSRRSGRAELARLVAELPAGDRRSGRRLAEDLAPAAGITPATARKYLTGLRGER